MTKMGTVLFSCHPDYLVVAGRVLTEALPDATTEVLGPDVASLASAVGISDVADLCRSLPVPFVRHLAAEDQRVLPDDAARAAVRLAQEQAGASVGLQVWTSGHVEVRAEALRAAIVDRLATAGISTARRGAGAILAVCATGHGVSMGVSEASVMLCDWPGGRVRLRAGPEQVSRSEFKLEELLQLFPLGLDSRRAVVCALDLGASPGGWTRLLRTYGLEVVAVDPGDLDHRLRDDAGIRHVRTTAGRYLQSADDQFDLVVNDMRMAPARSARVIVDAAPVLRRGGRVVLTLKVTPRTARADLDTARRLLRHRYTLRFARQLHHNRNEITLVLART